MRQVSFPVILMIAAAGCSGANSQLATCQAEKDQLLGTIRSQRDTTRALNQQVTSLESRLDQAEKEIARGSTGTRLSSRPQEPAARAPEPAVRQLQTPAPSPVKSDSLPWRSPASKSEPAQSVETKTRASNAKPSAASSLVSLARRDSRLQYDAKAQAARVDLPIAFDDKSATLTAAGKLKLDELAKLLKGDDARELRVVVAGRRANPAGEADTTRAQAAGWPSRAEAPTRRRAASCKFIWSNPPRPSPGGNRPSSRCGDRHRSHHAPRDGSSRGA
jgi:outer membrane protein OmpA-like peptidoglycan-associated protein